MTLATPATPHRNLRAALFGLLAATALVASTRAADAKPEFPRNIEKHLALGYEPGCSLCHDRASIGGSTVRTPFGLSMRAHGFKGGKSDLLPALDALDAEKIDSDADGVDDVDELRRGSDPNSPADAGAVVDPAYGCGARVARGRTRRSDAALLGAALVALAHRVRRRRRA